MAIGFTALLYKVGNTVPPKGNEGGMQRSSAGGPPKPPGTPEALPVDSVMAKYKEQLSPEVKDSLKLLESKLGATHNNGEIKAISLQLEAIWKGNHVPAMEAFYDAKIAKLENSEKNLIFAGSSFLQLMENEALPSIQMWEAVEAADCLEKALKKNPDNEETQLKLATAYLEGTGEPMKGVQILLGVVNKKPKDIPANLLLGRMSVRSGQMDKAMGRFQTVLDQDPDNTEALYFMAQVYKEKGDKDKAIELLKKCKRLVNKPEFTKEIDEYINSFK